MNLKDISAHLEKYILESDGNRLKAEDALRPELAGLTFFTAPLAGCTAADDSIFEEMKANPLAYGEGLRLPGEWLSGAKSVLSFFLPYTREVRVFSREGSHLPADEWLHARIEGHAFLLQCAREIARLLAEQGYKSVIPAIDSAFTYNKDMDRAKRGEPLFISNWSERHAAFACGLGTFGLSKQLITEKGVCGRFISIITDAVLDVTPRKYTEPYEYCSFCGACARNCHSGAIGEKAKDNNICYMFLEETKELFPPRYGCARCQIGVPCENGIPAK